MSESNVHKCPSCGGLLVYDPESECLECEYCNHSVDIEKLAVSIVENCFQSAMSDGMRSWSEDDIQSVRCQNCGAELIFGTHTKAQFCAYCGSSHIKVHDNEKTIPPGYLIPFKIPEKQAYQGFKTWIQKRWFAPSNLKTSYKDNRLIGTYIPYWTYDTQTQSFYSAQRGDYYYVTRTRVVNGKTETYQERKTRWTPVSGQYDLFFDDVLVCASQEIGKETYKDLTNYGLSDIEVYQSHYLSGFMAERYSVSLEDGWEQGKRFVDARLNTDIRQRIGGDEISGLRIHTTYDNITYKHILLPMWLSSYMYNQKTYRFMINGQSGKVSGQYPKSALKITLAVMLAMAVLMLLYVVISNA